LIPKNLRPIDYEEARKGLELAKTVLKKKPNLLILDEINLVLAGALVNVEDGLVFSRTCRKRLMWS